MGVRAPKRRRWPGIALASLLLPALLMCGAPVQYEPVVAKPRVHPARGHALILIDPGFTPDEDTAIVRAIDLWNEAANGNHIFEIVPLDMELIMHRLAKELPGGRCLDFIIIDRVTPLDPMVVKMDGRSRSGTVLGFAQRRPCSVSPVGVVPFRMQSTHQLTWVTMHEIGHAIGLDHHPARRAVMYRARNYDSTCTAKSCCIPIEDTKQLCQMLDCDVETTNYCGQ